MNDIHTFIELLVFLQMIDTSMYHDSPDPTFKGALALEGMYLGENLDESLL
jgi:hypothetical protein